MAPFNQAGKSGYPDLENQLNLIVGRSIAPVSIWLGIVYAFFSISHLFLLTEESALTMSVLAGSTSLIFFGLRVAARSISADRAHPIAVGMISLVLLNSLIQMILTRDVQQTTYLMLTFVGAAYFMLSTRWFMTVLAGGLTGWGFVLLQLSRHEGQAHFALGMAISVILSAVIHYVHIQATTKFVTTQANENRIRLELTALNSIIASLTSSLEPENVFQVVVDSVRSFMPHVDGASLQVLEGRDKFVTRAWTGGIHPEALTFYAGEGIVGLAASERQMINVPDVYLDRNFLRGAEKVSFHSLLVMPLVVGKKVVGVISVEASAVGAFGMEEERKIQLLAEYAAVAIENSRLYNEYALAEETLKNYTDHLQEIVESRTSELRTAQDKIFAQKGLEQEIDLARQVQASLLALEIPQLDGYVFAATAIPARYVGGDFYDFILKDGICNVIVADISGKGIPAAMLTSTARTLVRAATKYESGPALILSNMQDAIYPDLSHAEMFGTFFAASLDPKTATLTYANAGHTETIWWQHQRRTIERLPASGLPIGIIPTNEISQRQILLAPGDALVFYSDGVTETFNPGADLFGVERLMQLVTANGDDLAHTLAQRILTEVDSFANGAPLVDDLTLVVLKVVPRTVPFEYEIDLDRFDDAVHFVRQQVEPYGSDFAYQIELAVSELFTNIVKHAYQGKSGELRGEILLGENAVNLDLYDNGRAFDPAQLPVIDFDQAHESGYGLHIVRQIMDTVEYSSDHVAEQNHWHLEKLVGGGRVK